MPQVPEARLFQANSLGGLPSEQEGILLALVFLAMERVGGREVFSSSHFLIQAFHDERSATIQPPEFPAS
jgi:hypothetical protein